MTDHGFDLSEMLGALQSDESGDLVRQMVRDTREHSIRLKSLRDSPDAATNFEPRMHGPDAVQLVGLCMTTAVPFRINHPIDLHFKE